MRVLKFKLVIKIDDFTQYAPFATEELSEKGMRAGQYDYIKRRIQDDRNFWSEEVERTPDAVIQTKEAC